MKKKITDPSCYKYILVMDDEEGLREVIKMAINNSLSPDIYKVHTACCPEEAMKIYKYRSFDVIITDYNMYDINGFAFQKIVFKECEKKGNYNAPYFIHIGAIPVEEASISKNMYSVKFYTKPFECEQLVKCLKGLLSFDKNEVSHVEISEALKR